MVKLKKKSLSRGGGVFVTHGQVIRNKNFFGGPES